MPRGDPRRVDASIAPLLNNHLAGVRQHDNSQHLRGSQASRQDPRRDERRCADCTHYYYHYYLLLLLLLTLLLRLTLLLLTLLLPNDHRQRTKPRDPRGPQGVQYASAIIL